MSKEIYSYVKQLSKQFYTYYKTFSKIDREAKINGIQEKVQLLLCLSANMYFGDPANVKNIYEKMYLTVREIEFLIRDAVFCGIINKKLNLALSVIVSSLLKELKMILGF